MWDGTLDGAFDHVVNLKKYLIVGRVLLGIILVLMGLICCLALMSQAVTMAYLTSDIPTFISWMSNTYRTIIASYIMWFLSNGVLMGLGFAVFLLIKKTAADIQRAPLNPEMLRLSANYVSSNHFSMYFNYDVAPHADSYCWCYKCNHDSHTSRRNKFRVFIRS